MQSSPAGSSQWYMVRLLAAGGIDSTFGTSGIVTIDATTGFDTPTSCVTGNNGTATIMGNVDGAPLEDNAKIYRLIY